MPWPSAERSKTARPTHRLTGRATTSPRDRSRHRSRTGPPGRIATEANLSLKRSALNRSSTRQASARSSFSIPSLFAIAERSCQRRSPRRRSLPVLAVRRNVGDPFPQRPDDRGGPAASHRRRRADPHPGLARPPCLPSVARDPNGRRRGVIAGTWSTRSRGSSWLEYCTRRQTLAMRPAPDVTIRPSLTVTDGRETAIVQDFFSPTVVPSCAVEFPGCCPARRSDDVLRSWPFGDRIEPARVRTWPLQRLFGPTPVPLLPLYPLWFSRLDLRRATSSSAARSPSPTRSGRAGRPPHQLRLHAAALRLGPRHLPRRVEPVPRRRGWRRGRPAAPPALGRRDGRPAGRRRRDLRDRPRADPAPLGPRRETSSTRRSTPAASRSRTATTASSSSRPGCWPTGGSTSPSRRRRARSRTRRRRRRARNGAPRAHGRPDRPVPRPGRPADAPRPVRPLPRLSGAGRRGLRDRAGRGDGGRQAGGRLRAGGVARPSSTA